MKARSSVKIVNLLVACAMLAACGSNAGSGPQWEVVWSDDFDGDALDTSKWKPEESCWGGGNDERQCYTGRTDNIAVEEGALRLVARPEVYEGFLNPVEKRTESPLRRTQQYTSGKVRTRDIVSWKYGRFSARMKLPEGQGTWPAFWMMPQDSAYGRWPLSGEIDIMEAVNLGTPCDECLGGAENRTSGALHFGELPPENTYLFNKTESSASADPSGEWHVYAVEWADGVIQWLVDGEVFLRATAEDWYTGSPKAEGREAAPFDQPFYLMLNLAVGGRLPEEENGQGFDPTSFPAELTVDWVRVEQCRGDPTGRACLSDQAWDGEPRGPWEPEKQANNQR